jgi:hypothetical protein
MNDVQIEPFTVELDISLLSLYAGFVAPALPLRGNTIQGYNLTWRIHSHTVAKFQIIVNPSICASPKTGTAANRIPGHGYLFHKFFLAASVYPSANTGVGSIDGS